MLYHSQNVTTRSMVDTLVRANLPSWEHPNRVKPVACVAALF